ncbi:hypothetical protein BDN72DRAFT_857492 [Pluteus cervinus]|uniref:Uncharacterized protein n=1 Tax=Pluteus cervinus TaxID=181527 RepID=A0ACD3AWN2_9AGAR|nr:hypothetical protein BDN72DRAFT_857492 [Pluteus cervinus]
MPSLGKFSAWIEVDGQHLPEYLSEVSDDLSTITCWVPSEAGKEFAVRWRDSNLDYTQCGRVYVDGQYCSGMVSVYPKRQGVVVSRVDGMSTGPFTTRALIFSNIDLTDDDQFLQSSSHVENIGEIKLVITECIITGNGTFIDQSKSFPEKVKVHERSKKGMGHRMGLGKEKRHASSKSTISKDVRVVATFVFRYRPLGKLFPFLSTANGIAPVDKSKKRKASTPPEQPSKDEADKATRAAEIEALEARLRDLKGHQTKRVKTEVKTEPLSSLRPPKNLGVIDLTDLD